MEIEISVKDRDGLNLELGDRIELFDWSIHNPESLGIATLVWNSTEGRISTYPCIIKDVYDFYSKALPRCKKVK